MVSMKKRSIENNPVLEALFNNVASEYSYLGPPYFQYYGEKLVEKLNIMEGTNVLDVAMGRGASLFPAAKKAGPKGKVIGIDFSEGMVRETQKEIEKLNIKHVNVFQMCAEQICFDQSSFDSVLCGLAIAFFSDYKKALQEFYRVLKPNGIFGLSAWQREKSEERKINKIVRQIMGKYLSPIVINPPSKPLIKSQFTQRKPEFGDENELYRILEDAGFRNIQISLEHKTFLYKDGEEWWQDQWSHAGRIPFEILERKSKELLEAFKLEVFRAFDSEFGTDGIPLDCDVLVAYGYK